VTKTEKLEGSVEAPPSKAHTHRALIAAAISDGRSTIERPLVCEDTLATVEACSMLGAGVRSTGQGFTVEGAPRPATPEDVINCRDSGSTIRFMTPVCALADGITVLTGSASLRGRPMGPLLDALGQLGVRCHSARADGRPPIVVFGGGIEGGRASIRGDVSSQFVSGLLFAAPRARSRTEIRVTTRLESRPYVAMTLALLRDHGIGVDPSPDYRRFTVPPGQDYAPASHIIEGDYSSAAFLLAAASATESHVRVAGLPRKTLQGDQAIVTVLQRMGAHVEAGGDYVEVRGLPGGLRGAEVEVRDTPDLAPACAALACLARGRTVIRGGGRLRFKESDRIAALSAELGKMGGGVAGSGDGLVIEGGRLHGAEVDSHRDHRVAMACAVAALGAEGTTVIHGIECVNKSYPGFVEDLRSLGAEAHVR